MFEARAIEISLQAGSMMGVEKEERIATPWHHSLKLRHPWLQLNLLTAFLAAAVVGLFQDTLDRLVILALFLPVLAGQSGNTGCQALAVTLRGMTLGELKPGAERRLVSKEAWLGCLNGVGVGLAAGIGMLVTAAGQHQARAVHARLVVFLAMIGACVASGVSGALVPLTLKRLGFDPASASSIFLTTRHRRGEHGNAAGPGYDFGALAVNHLARHPAVGDEVLPGDEARLLEIRNATSSPTSSGRPARPTGCCAWSFRESLAFAIQPGLMQFTRMRGPRLMASAWVSATTPPFVAA
jgi:cation transporter-like permease